MLKAVGKLKVPIDVTIFITNVPYILILIQNKELKLPPIPLYRLGISRELANLIVI